MQTLTSKSVQIAYEVFGSQDGSPALLLISGLGEQMVAWPDDFCRLLADSGFFVIRFDNRDAGLSAKLEELGVPDLLGSWAAYFRGETVSPMYTLQDMADDAVGVLDELGIEKSYVCGFSLGGMIAQNMAFGHPDRLHGLICMGSSTGDQLLPTPTPEAQAVMATPPPLLRDEYAAHMASVFETFSGGSKLYSRQCRSETAARSFDRCFYPLGFMRQSVAMLADGSRKERLEKLKMHTLVLHGEMDVLAQPEHGQAIAAAVNRARIVLVPEWGHGLDYPELWPQFKDHFIAFCKDG